MFRFAVVVKCVCHARVSKKTIHVYASGNHEEIASILKIVPRLDIFLYSLFAKFAR